ncbi:response regulator [Pelomonas sp. BJYL3]|uniref:response regulator n=1 Tax=Pelomonas sp. BJYL3 TaxID=2976697 RepID=UPI0022B3FA36|nr:response regulator [Pelomonas sp. BJYL3]
MKKILIVDDQHEIRELLRMTLELAQSFSISEAGTAAEALERVRLDGPELVLMDVMLPGGMSGLEACRLIKQMPEARPTPKVIIVSARPFEDLRAEFEASGADLFIAKPFGPMQLVQGISKLYSQPPG